MRAIMKYMYEAVTDTMIDIAFKNKDAEECSPHLLPIFQKLRKCRSSLGGLS